MMRAIGLPLLAIIAVLSQPAARATGLAENHQTTYYWKATPASDSAQLLTLLCTPCGSNEGAVPLIAVLRDRLAGTNADGIANDRLTDVWLLTYAPLTLHGRLLSAVPFFYWRVGEGSTKVPGSSLKPFMDLTTPEHSVVSGLGRDLLQVMTLDPATMAIRASSHAYRANEIEHERVQLEEAVSYLRMAPTSEDSSEITNEQRDYLIARLELRKRLLGGLVANRNAGRVGQQAGFEEERIRSRNWELLRQCAEKTSLLFEPLTVAGVTDQYAMLWFSPGVANKPEGSNLGPVWKLLNLRDPWTDGRLKNWHGLAKYQGDGTHDPGRLMIPLGVYSLDYPASPLLLIDFRDNLHIRRHEMTQRTINEIVSGIVGISHFTNWYFYAGSFLYDFVVGRHGTATNQAQRLDSYSSFRTALALDRNLDAGLRNELQRRMNSISLNPLDGSPAREIALAESRSRVLESDASNGTLAAHLDEHRRAELAEFGHGQQSAILQAVLHVGSFGLYTRRVKPEANNLDDLKRARQTQADLELLDGLEASGGKPEVVYDPARIQSSVKQLSASLSSTTQPDVRAHAERTLKKLRLSTEDPILQQECATALNLLNGPQQMNIATSVRATAPLHSFVEAK